MFEQGGISYVYAVYGRYACFNVVTEGRGVGAAVLIRAIEPLSGIIQLWHNRFGDTPFDPSKTKKLCSGPGKLCMGLAITVENDNCKSLRDSNLLITDCPAESAFEVAEEYRIGLKKGKEEKLRFLIKENRYVSKRVRQ
jgi:DNA-3-methyladenine glycosylase